MNWWKRNFASLIVFGIAALLLLWVTGRWG